MKKTRLLLLLALLLTAATGAWAQQAATTYKVTIKEGTTDADKWTITPTTAKTTGVAEGTKVTLQYTGRLKVKGVKAISDAAPAGPTEVKWNSTNVFNSTHAYDQLNSMYKTPLTYEDITISFSGTGVSFFYAYDEGLSEAVASLLCQGGDGDSFTFTAPSGKKFSKIEINDNGSVSFTAYGNWTKPANNKIQWSGTAASTVTLGGSNMTIADNLASIVFTLVDAE